MSAEFPTGNLEARAVIRSGAVRIQETPDLVAELTRAASRLQAAEVERRILEGENDFQVGRVRYLVPRWTDAPITRFRIEWRRRRFRAERVR